MNPDQPSREQIEARLTALLLGELPAAEAELLRWTISRDPELQKLHDQLKVTIGFVSEAMKNPTGVSVDREIPLKLTQGRRGTLLAHFKTPRPQPAQKSFWLRRFEISYLNPLAVAATVILIICGVVAISIPNFVVSRSTSQSNAIINNLRQIDAAKDEWALEQGKSPRDVPTPSDLTPYLEGGAMRSVAGENYVLGKVSEPAVAEIDGKRLTASSENVQAMNPVPPALAGSFDKEPSLTPKEGKSSMTPLPKIALPNTESSQTALEEAASPVFSQHVVGYVNTSPGPSAPGSSSSGSPQPNLETASPFANRLEALRTPEMLAPPLPSAAPFQEEDTKATAITENAPVNSADWGGAGSDQPPLIPRETQNATPVLNDVTTLGALPASKAENSPAALALMSPRLRQQYEQRNGSIDGVQPEVPAVTAVTGLNYGVSAASASPVAIGPKTVLNGLLESSAEKNGVNGNYSYGGGGVGGTGAGGATALPRNLDSQNAKKFLDNDGRLISIAQTPVTAPEVVASEGMVHAQAGLPPQSQQQLVQMERAWENPVSDKQADIPLSQPEASAPISQPEIQTSDNAFSTFSLNVSDVSFRLAMASLGKGQMPTPASIRSEEFINAFDYRDPEPVQGQPLGFAFERAIDPFAHERDFLRFSIKAAAVGRQSGRALNLVLLLDTSGSMERADRVAIIREALRVLAAQLQPQDTISVVTFARTARLWADGLPGGQAGATLDKVGSITPEGGTNLEEAMRLAYETALRHFIAGGMNRVVLLTDGAANLGNVDPEALTQKVETERRQGIALDCFGIGWDDYNDDLLEDLSSNGDGRYAFINSPDEAATEFAAKLAGALQVAAEDVKVQVEFNPNRVTAWRQIGYAKHQLTKQQFRDNSVAAGAIAAREAGNALYVIETRPDGEGPIATVRVRYRIPGTQDNRERSWLVDYTGAAPALAQSSPPMRLAATAAELSEWLADSPFAQDVTLDELLNYLNGVPQFYGADKRPEQLEWMIREAKSVSGK